VFPANEKAKQPHNIMLLQESTPLFRAACPVTKKSLPSHWGLQQKYPAKKSTFFVIFY